MVIPLLIIYLPITAFWTNIWGWTLTTCFIMSATSFDDKILENDDLSCSRERVAFIDLILSKYFKTK
jgi:hypothetical protein